MHPDLIPHYARCRPSTLAAAFLAPWWPALRSLLSRARAAPKPGRSRNAVRRRNSASAARDGAALLASRRAGVAPTQTVVMAARASAGRAPVSADSSPAGARAFRCRAVARRRIAPRPAASFARTGRASAHQDSWIRAESAAPRRSASVPVSAAPPTRSVAARPASSPVLPEGPASAPKSVKNASATLTVMAPGAQQAPVAGSCVWLRSRVTGFL